MTGPSCPRGPNFAPFPLSRQCEFDANPLPRKTGVASSSHPPLQVWVTAISPKQSFAEMLSRTASDLAQLPADRFLAGSHLKVTLVAWDGRHSARTHAPSRPTLLLDINFYEPALKLNDPRHLWGTLPVPT